MFTAAGALAFQLRVPLLTPQIAHMDVVVPTTSGKKYQVRTWVRLWFCLFFASQWIVEYVQYIRRRIVLSPFWEDVGLANENPPIPLLLLYRLESLFERKCTSYQFVVYLW